MLKPNKEMSLSKLNIAAKASLQQHLFGSLFGMTIIEKVTIAYEVFSIPSSPRYLNLST